MGYNAELTEGELVIENDKLEDGTTYDGALKALNAVEHWGSSLDASTLEKALDELGFEDVEADSERVVAISFYSKWRGQDDFLLALGPYVKEGTRLCFRGEDGALWGYEYEGGKCHPLSATVTWARVP